MIDTILTVVYILVAVAMVVLILLQRGAGAQAGSGFGAGASGTVFGARGSANFLTKSTKWLAFVFFVVALFMAWKAVNRIGPGGHRAGACRRSGGSGDGYSRDCSGGGSRGSAAREKISARMAQC
jgi:protein translocase SecG subunit